MQFAPMTLMLLLLAWLAVSCNGTTCTAIGWEDSVTIEFEPVLAADGTWKLELSNGYDGTCELTLPPPEGTETLEYFPCESSGEGYVDIRLDSAPALRYAKFFENPASFDLRVSLDGVVLFEETLTPEYEKWYPNGGEDCGTQFVGSIKVDVF